jgi:hypothetical protein
MLNLSRPNGRIFTPSTIFTPFNLNFTRVSEHAEHQLGIFKVAGFCVWCPTTSCSHYLGSPLESIAFIYPSLSLWPCCVYVIPPPPIIALAHSQIWSRSRVIYDVRSIYQKADWNFSRRSLSHPLIEYKIIQSWFTFFLHLSFFPASTSGNWLVARAIMLSAQAVCRGAQVKIQFRMSRVPRVLLQIDVTRWGAGSWPFAWPPLGWKLLAAFCARRVCCDVRLPPRRRYMASAADRTAQQRIVTGSHTAWWLISIKMRLFLPL